MAENTTVNEGTKKVEEIDWENFDVGKIPEQVIAKTSHFKGHAQQLRDTREALSQARNDLDLLSKTIGDREDEGKVEDSALTDDSLMTYGEVKQIIEKEKVKLAEERQKHEKETLNKRILESEKLVHDKYAADKVPTGLDANTVLDEGLKWLQKNKPKLVEDALSSSNPAEAIYDYALKFVPKFEAIVKADQNAKYLDTIKNPRIRGGRSGTPDDIESNEYSSAFMQLLNKPTSELIREGHEELVAESEMKNK